MAIPAQSLPDELIATQQVLLEQIKRSHRLFVQRFWVMLVISILALSLVALLFFFEDEDSFPSIFITIEIVPFIILVRSFKENWVFLKWSGPYLREIEESGKTSAILTGLTAYVNRLYHAAFLDTPLGREQPDLTPGQFLERITTRQKLKFIVLGLVLGLVLAGIIAFVNFSGPMNIERLIMLGAPILGIFAIAVVMVIFQAIWMRSLKRWAQLFQELDEWGRQLERAFLKPDFDEKGGA